MEPIESGMSKEGNGQGELLPQGMFPITTPTWVDLEHRVMPAVAVLVIEFGLILNKASSRLIGGGLIPSLPIERVFTKRGQPTTVLSTVEKSRSTEQNGSRLKEVLSVTESPVV